MKNFLKSLCLASLVACAIASCEEPPQETPVTIHLNKELISNLPVGSEQTLVATVKPEGADVSVIWSSDNEEVAVVNDEGVVTGVAPGTATITAKAENSTATCKVTVTAVKPTKIQLSEESVELTVGAEHTLSVTLTPENAVAEDIAWSTSDDKVATINDGVIKAVTKGKATITVKCNGGSLAATCLVEVVEEKEEVKVTAIKVSPISLALEVGGQGTLTVSYTPSDAVASDLVWESGDNTVATVDNGVVTALKAGKAMITAKCNGGELSSSCEVTVTDKVPEQDQLKSVMIVSQNGITDVQVGLTLQLGIMCDPADYEPKTVSWTIDNEALALVDQSGLVTGSLAQKGSDNEWMCGVVSVNVDGIAANLKLRVIPRQAEDIVVDMPENNTLRIGEGWSFNPVVLPEDIGFPVIAISDPYGNISEGFYTSPYAPGKYSYIFTLSDHEDLVNEYKIQKSVSIDVIPYWVETVSVAETCELELGSSLTLSATFTSDVEGKQPTYTDVKWTSSAPQIVSVNESTGEIVAHAVGTAEITATTSSEWSVPSGQSQKSATCVVTVKESEVTLNIGDYYYSDGTWSSELDPGKTVIGVVFAKVNAAASDSHLASDYPDCTHGLVVSTEEYFTTCTDGRGWSWADLGSWCSDNGYGQYYDLEKPVGYSNTVGYQAAIAAGVQSYGYTIDFTMFGAGSQLMTHRNAVEVPASASCWYIPSYKEMVMLHENVDVVNQNLENAGGDAISVKRASYNDTSFQYWCSSYDLSNKVIRAFSMLDGGWMSSSKSENATLGCRVVLAF